MKKSYHNSIEYQAVQLIEATSQRIFLRQDFHHLGSYRQVSRALNKLIAKKKIVKIGLGVYAKAYVSQYIDIPLIEDGFDVVAREALDRFDVDWQPSDAEQAYNNGQTQQVPVQNIVRLKSRFRRKLSYAGRELFFENRVNAK